MRKLPRRLPSNTPSLAWVGFAVLLLAIGGGLAGLYTHRQNQEGAKLRLIQSLKDDVQDLQVRRENFERQFRDRVKAAPLKLALQKHHLELRPVEPEERVLMTLAPRLVVPAEPSASPSGPETSVMAVVAPR
jgi:hypothetical protein